MKKILALFAVLCCATAAFAQFHEDDAVVRWKTIVGNITVSNNDAVGGINPWDHSLEHSRRKGSRQSSDRTCFLRCRWTRVEWRECHRHSGRG